MIIGGIVVGGVIIWELLAKFGIYRGQSPSGYLYNISESIQSGCPMGDSVESRRCRQKFRGVPVTATEETFPKLSPEQESEQASMYAGYY